MGSLTVDTSPQFVVPDAPSAVPAGPGATSPPPSEASASAAVESKPGVGGAPTLFDRTVAPQGPAISGPRILTGTHWATPADFPALKKAGYDFAVVTAPPGNSAQLNSMLDAAHAAGLKLVVGAQPYPFVHSGNGLDITPAGVQFLQALSKRPDDVMGVFVFNEPFWTDPLTGHNSNKGVYTAKQLGDLNDKIRAAYPGAKIFQDIGAPSAWAPGGFLGTGAKYPIDQMRRVADYWGIFGNGAEPFLAGGVYDKEKALQQIEKEVKFVKEQLGGVPIVDAQSYRAPKAGITGYPSDAQIHDWNCTLRSRVPELGGISWYVWRQTPLYQDFLANHPSQLPLTGPSACPADPPHGP